MGDGEVRCAISRIVAFIALVILPWTAEAQKKADVAMRDQAAKELAEAFLKAVTRPDDVESVLKICAAPFLLGGKVFKTRDELKEVLAPLLRNYSQPPPSQEVSVVYTLAGLPGGVLNEAEHKLFSEVLAKADRIVFFRVQRRLIAIAVRGEEGKARVAGIHINKNLLPLLMIAHAKEKSDERLAPARDAAKATAAAFVKAMKAKDHDGMMALAEVPWYSDGNLVKDRDELKTLLKPRDRGRQRRRTHWLSSAGEESAICSRRIVARPATRCLPRMTRSSFCAHKASAAAACFSSAFATVRAGSLARESKRFAGMGEHDDLSFHPAHSALGAAASHARPDYLRDLA